VLRDDHRPDSDVDVLISFGPDGGMTLESFMEMRMELSEMFGGREVDLVEKRLVRNPFRRHRILTTRRVLYAAR
jgi:predicted nucleotidyltransferase